MISFLLAHFQLVTVAGTEPSLGSQPQFPAPGRDSTHRCQVLGLVHSSQLSSLGPEPTCRSFPRVCPHSQPIHINSRLPRFMMIPMVLLSGPGHLPV